MITWLYMKDDKGIWWVGYYKDNQWVSKEDYNYEQDAQERAKKLNGFEHVRDQVKGVRYF